MRNFIGPTALTISNCSSDFVSTIPAKATEFKLRPSALSARLGTTIINSRSITKLYESFDSSRFDSSRQRAGFNLAASNALINVRRYRLSRMSPASEASKGIGGINVMLWAKGRLFSASGDPGACFCLCCPKILLMGGNGRPSSLSDSGSSCRCLCGWL